MTGEDKGSRKRAIRLKCLDCCCGAAYEVRLCPLRNCPLWRFRLGTQCREETRESQLRELRATCVNEVKRTNGSYSLKDAVDLQRG